MFKVNNKDASIVNLEQISYKHRVDRECDSCSIKNLPQDTLSQYSYLRYVITTGKISQIYKFQKETPRLRFFVDLMPFN